MNASGEPGSAHALLAPMFAGMMAEVRAAAARAAAARRRRPPRAGEVATVEDEDAEAIHDFRVALRRLRTLLRIVRSHYGKNRIAAVAEDLKHLADTTGAVRDEEVLRETLGALDLDAPSRAALAAWIERRRRQERSRRGAATRELRGAVGDARSGAAGVERPLERLARRIAKGPRHDHGATALAREALQRARDDVLAHAGADPADALAMHLLRIRFKRLRYTAELFAPALPPEAARIARAAAKLQKRLGELHDADEALVRVGRAWGLPAAAREATLAALRNSRARLAERARGDLVSELSSWLPTSGADEARAAHAPRAAARVESSDDPGAPGSRGDGAA